MPDWNSSQTQGVHYLGLTVPDLERTRDFLTQLLRFEPVGEVPGGIRLELIAAAA